MFNNYICALDIGSSKIAASVARVKRKQITDIFFEMHSSGGVSKGALIDAVELVGSIGAILKRLKAKSGVNIKFIYTNFSGDDLITKNSRAIIPLAERGNKIITLSDIEKVSEQARILGSGLEEEIIAEIPLSYTIDSKSNIFNPLGLYSHRLEVDLYLICGKLSSIQSLTRAVNQAGYEIKDLFFSGLATAHALFDEELKNETNILCDIGSDITELLLFEDGRLKHVEILSIGGNDLSWELAKALKIPLDLAEEIKKTHAAAGDSSLIADDKEILVKKDNLYKPIKHKSVNEIVTAKTKLICQILKERTERIAPLSKIDNFIAVGGSVLLEGFLEILETSLGIPVKLGRIGNPQILSLVNQEEALLRQKYLNYLTCLGILCQVLNSDQPPIAHPHKPCANFFINSINRVKEVYQEYF